MRSICSAGAIVIGLAIPATPLAQGGRGGPQGPPVVSPQVNTDRSVTLRVLAPKAPDIAVTGEILSRRLLAVHVAYLTISVPRMPRAKWPGNEQRNG
jgi:hypothetical protein